MTEIKEYKILINSLTETNIRHATGLLNGLLECIYISSLFPINIFFFLKNSEIDIFKVQSHNGRKVYFPRYQASFDDGQAYTFSNEKLALNDEVVFRVETPEENEIEVVIRYG